MSMEKASVYADFQGVTELIIIPNSLVLTKKHR